MTVPIVPLPSVGTSPNSQYLKPQDLNAIIQAGVKNWHDLNARNPGLTRLTGVTTAVPTPTGAVSAQTTPTLSYLQNPALTKTPQAVAQTTLGTVHNYLTDVPDPKIIAALPKPAASNFDHPSSWFGKVINGIENAPIIKQIGEQLHIAAQGVDQAVAKVFNPDLVKNNVSSSLYHPGILNDAQPPPDIKLSQALNLSRGDPQTPEQLAAISKPVWGQGIPIVGGLIKEGRDIAVGNSSIGQALGRAPAAIADTTENLAQDPITYAPFGLLGDLGKMGYIAVRGGKDAAEARALAKTTSPVYTPVPGAAEAGIGGTKSVVESLAQGKARGDAAKLASTTAQQLHDATIADQLHNVVADPATESTVTHTIHDPNESAVPIIPTVAEGAPAAHPVVPTAEAPALATTVNHQYLGEVGADELDAHLAKLRTGITAAKGKVKDYKGFQANAMAKGDESLIRSTTKTLAKHESTVAQLTRDLKYTQKLRAQLPTGPAVSVAADTVPAADIAKLQAQHDELRSGGNGMISEAKRMERDLESNGGVTPTSYNHEADYINDLHIRGQAKLKEADALKAQIEAAGITPEAEAVAKTAGQDEVASVAAQKVAEGAAPHAPTALDKAAAHEREALNDPNLPDGRPGFNIRRTLAGKRYTGDVTKHTLVHAPQDQMKAYQKATNTAIKHIEQITDPAQRAEVGNRVVQAQLDRYKIDSQIFGHDPQMSGDFKSVAHQPEAHKLYAADIHRAATVHGTGKLGLHFNIAPSASEAVSHVVPQSTQMVAASTALDVDKLAVSDATKIKKIVTAMRADRELNKSSGGVLLGTRAYNAFARTILKAVPDLKVMAADNLAAIVRKEQEDTAAVLNHATDSFDAGVTGEGASRTSSVETLADLGALVDKAAEAAGGVSPTAQQAAAAGLAQHVAQSGIMPLDIDLARAAKANSRDVMNSPTVKGGPSAKVKKNGNTRRVASHKAMNKAADDAIIPGLGDIERAAYMDEPAIDLGHRKIVQDWKIGYGTNTRALYALGTTLKRWMSDTGVTVPRDLLRGHRSIFTQLNNEYNAVAAMAKASVKDNPSAAKVAIQAWQSGHAIDAATNPAAYDFYNNFLVRAGRPDKGLVTRIFEAPNANPTMHTFFSHMPDDFNEANRILDFAGVDKKLRFNLDAVDKTQPLAKQKLDAYSQVHSWDFGDDPVAELAKINSAMIYSKQFADMAVDAVVRFGSAHAVTPAWKHVVNTQEMEHFSRFIPPETYFHPDIAHQLGALEAGLRKGINFPNSNAAGRFINRTVDPVFNLLRRTQTIARPSSPMRNMIGDYAQTAISDNKWSPKYTLHAIQALQSVGAIKENALFGISQALDGAAVGGSGKFLTIHFKGGATKDLTKPEFMQMMMQDGMHQSTQQSDEVLADLFSGDPNVGTQPLGKLADKISHRGYLKKMTQIADTQGSISRIAQSDGLFRDPKFTGQYTEKEFLKMRQDASSRVRATHPDPSGLTHVEQKYVKRLFSYYTWARSIIVPTILSMINNPRTLVLFPEFTNMLNEIAGSDPTSVSDQWSNQVPRPDYLTKSATGAFGNIGGIAGQMLGDTPGRAYGGDLGTSYEALVGGSGLLTGATPGEALRNLPTRAAAGLSPYVQAPFAAFTGKDLSDSGAKTIRDGSDYIDALIPGVNQLSDMSGVSVAGTVGNMFGLYHPQSETGSPNPSTNFRFDPQAAVASGDKRPWGRNATTINALSPLRVTQINTGSIQNSALRDLLTKQGWGTK